MMPTPMRTFAFILRVVGSVATAMLLLSAFLFHLKFGPRPDELEVRLFLIIAAFQTILVSLTGARILDALAESRDSRSALVANGVGAR